MSDAPAPLPLKDRTPLARGKHRLVFEHPLDAGLLIKLPNEAQVRAARGEGGPWYRRPRRYRQHLGALREVQEHLALHALAGGEGPHLQTLVGFVDTDLGLGLVSRKVLGRDGALAPTLTRLVRERRFDAAAQAALDRLCHWLLQSPLLLGDLNARNLVYGFDARHGERFVIIDGIGEKTLIPLNRWSATVRRITKRRQIRRLRAAIQRLREKADAAAAAA